MTPQNGLSLKDTVYLQACHILRSTGLSLADVSKHFFHAFHIRLPVISPNLFYEAAIETQYSPPQADFSLLILAKCLTVLPPPTGSIERSIKPEDVYIFVKALFAQVQAVIHASTTLVQASILVSAYEYAIGRPEAAYITIGTCVRMVQLLGLDGGCKIADETISDSKSVLARLEDGNIRWAVAILERYIKSFSPSFEQERL